MTVQEYILQETKCKDFEQLKKKLKRMAKYEYGCYFSEIKCKSFRAYYTSNENHFCSYGLTFNGIGVATSYGIDKDCITKAGIERNCASHYVPQTFLNKEYTQ